MPESSYHLLQGKCLQDSPVVSSERQRDNKDIAHRSSLSTTWPIASTHRAGVPARDDDAIHIKYLRRQPQPEPGLIYPNYERAHTNVVAHLREQVYAP